jgi:peptidoglycan/xylan/chitin deacetylase (PgdA/CDA1 family)
MKLAVGIYDPAPAGKTSSTIGWKILCEQEKAPFISTAQPECPVMVFEDQTPDWLATFMAEGGIGIVTGSRPDSLPFEVEYAGDASIENVDLADLGSSVARVQCITRLYRGSGYGRIKVHENRAYKTGLIQDEYPVFLYAGFGKGGCFYTGLPFSRLLMALGDTLRTTASFSNYSERIVSIDKHHLLKAMREILVLAFHKRDLPYIHLGYYPASYQSALAFRIDIDGVFGENLLNLSKSALEHGFRLTFFANKSLCVAEEGLLQKIDPAHEIGNHADVHNLYSDLQSNLKNIQACKDWLNQLGIDDHQIFSAPRGLWNAALHEALQALGYRYTSDFGAAIAGFPYFPYINGLKSATLQVPVNPFSAERASIWRMEAEGREIDVEFISGFFSRSIEENYRQGYPNIIYSHPEKFGGMAGPVFQRLRQKISDLNLWETTLTEFAAWWIRRDKTEFWVELNLSTKKTTLIGNIDTDFKVKEI